MAERTHLISGQNCEKIKCATTKQKRETRTNQKEIKIFLLFFVNNPPKTTTTPRQKQTSNVIFSREKLLFLDQFWNSIRGEGSENEKMYKEKQNKRKCKLAEGMEDK